MLNIRTFTLSVALFLILVFTTQLLLARTEVISEPSSNPASVIQNQQPSVNQNIVHLPKYRSSLDECFDVSLMDLANCRSERQVSIPSYRNPLDTCFDVPLKDVISCRNADQMFVR